MATFSKVVELPSSIPTGSHVYLKKEEGQAFSTHITGGGKLHPVSSGNVGTEGPYSRSNHVLAADQLLLTPFEGDVDGEDLRNYNEGLITKTGPNIKLSMVEIPALTSPFEGLIDWNTTGGIDVYNTPGGIHLKLLFTGMAEVPAGVSGMSWLIRNALGDVVYFDHFNNEEIIEKTIPKSELFITNAETYTVECIPHDENGNELSAPLRFNLDLKYWLDSNYKSKLNQAIPLTSPMQSFGSNDGFERFAYSRYDNSADKSIIEIYERQKTAHTLIQTIEHLGSSVNSITFSSPGNFLAYFMSDNVSGKDTLAIYRYINGQYVFVEDYNHPTHDMLNALAFSANEARLAVSSWNSVRVFDLVEDIEEPPLGDTYHFDLDPGSLALSLQFDGLANRLFVQDQANLYFYNFNTTTNDVYDLEHTFVLPSNGQAYVSLSGVDVLITYNNGGELAYQLYRGTEDLDIWTAVITESSILKYTGDFTENVSYPINRTDLQLLLDKSGFVISHEGWPLFVSLTDSMDSNKAVLIYEDNSSTGDEGEDLDPTQLTRILAFNHDGSNCLLDIDLSLHETGMNSKGSYRNIVRGEGYTNVGMFLHGG